MKGSIRVIFGLILTLGAVGGMENATDYPLPLHLVIAVVGILSMYSGVRSIKDQG